MIVRDNLEYIQASVLLGQATQKLKVILLISVPQVIALRWINCVYLLSL